MTDLFADIPTIPECDHILLERYKTPERIAAGMIAEAREWQRRHPDKDVMDIIPPTWKEYVKFNL